LLIEKLQISLKEQAKQVWIQNATPIVKAGQAMNMHKLNAIYTVNPFIFIANKKNHCFAFSVYQNTLTLNKTIEYVQLKMVYQLFRHRIKS